MKERRNQKALKSPSCRTSLSVGPLKWILLGPVLTLLLHANSFGAGSWSVLPHGQPTQISSKVYYDPALSDRFFRSNEWSYPYGGQVVQDGMWPEGVDPPRLKHTAKCFSTSFGSKHRIRFCKARLLDVGMIDLFIHEKNPAFRDALRVRIRNGEFTSQYWTRYITGPRPNGYMWTTIRQALILDKKTYRNGDVIKGRIDFECVEDVTERKSIEKYGRLPTIIRIFGVFRTKIE
ncbi:MAG: hypothetical protein V1792_15390 [Pseudomonadota bacterium]